MNTTQKNEIDMLHQNMVRDSTRQSERDEPWKSTRAGFCDGSKMTAMERVRNLHELLVLSYTQSGYDTLSLAVLTHLALEIQISTS